MITLILIGVTVLVSVLAEKQTRIKDRLIMWPPAITRKRQYERLLTHGFIHQGLAHLLFNMITLFFFGRAIEGTFGPGMAGQLGFLFFYVSAILMAILPTYLRHKNDANYASLGASGAVSAVLFAYVLYAPWSKMIIFPIPVPIPAIVFAVLYIGYSIWMDRRGGDRLNHSAHLWGAVYGIAFMLATRPQLLQSFVAELSRGP